MSGALLVEDEDPCDPIYVGNSVSNQAPVGANLDANGVPKSAPVGADPVGPVVVIAPAEQQRQRTQILNGTNEATKLIKIGGLFSIEELLAGAAFEFNQTSLESIFTVHGRSQETRNNRVGDLSNVIVLEMALVEAYNNHYVPVEFSSTMFTGKVYPLYHQSPGLTMDGRNNRVLAILPSGFTRYDRANLIYRRERQDLHRMAQITGSFDPNQLLDNLQPITAPKRPPHFLVPDTHYVHYFISRHSTKWRLPTTLFQHFEGHTLYPQGLVKHVVKLLNEMHSNVSKKKNNLREFPFRVRAICTGGCAIAGALPAQSQVWVGATLYVKYSFLNEEELVKPLITAD